MAAKSFDVLFVGLICFRKDDRYAVLPDGRAPDDPGIPPHTPFLVVDPDKVTASSGWEGNDPAHTAKGVYTFGNCTIRITKATEGGGTLDATQHDPNVFKLWNADPAFEFATVGAQIITWIPIRQGKLELLRRPDSDANVSRLRVEHDGDVTVTVIEGGATRVLVLEPGTDVAIANLPLSVNASHTGNPSKLYGRIARSGTVNIGKPDHVPGMPALGRGYQVFKIGLPSIFTPLSGCCPPP